MRILLVEDDAALAQAVLGYLHSKQFKVDLAPDLTAARALVAVTHYATILLDLNLPDGDGLELLQHLPRRDDAPTVVVVTARDQVSDRIRGLDTGADDYLTKPFSMSELSARIRAVLRRIRPALADDRVRRGDIIIDRVAHRVKRGGRDVHLGPTEFRLLDYLMQYPGRVFSREQLLDAVWGSDVYVEARTVDVHIGRLRKALNKDMDDDPIRTVRSAGYSLDLDA